MRLRTIGVVLGALGAILLVVWLGGDRTGARPAAPPPAASPRARGDESEAPPREQARPAIAKVGPGVDGGGSVDRAARWRRLLGAVRAAQARRVAATRAGSSTPPPDDAVGTLDPDTIRNGIREMKELLAECYELALREQPRLAGRLVVEFTLVGEPSVGAVVEESRIDPDSELGGNAALGECVRETVMTLELPAPPQGGRVEVRYPFVFRTEDEAQ